MQYRGTPIQTRKFGSLEILTKFIYETGVSRHHGVAPSNRSDHHSTIVSRRLRGTLSWSSIMPRNASLSDSLVSSLGPLFPKIRKYEGQLCALRLVVRSSFVFASSNCDWLKYITWSILANHSCCLQKINEDRTKSRNDLSFCRSNPFSRWNEKRGEN